MNALTQKAIDAPGRWLKVKDTDLPVRKKTYPEDPHVFDYERANRKPPLSKGAIPIKGTFECKKGDRSECIPGESIIQVLRREAAKQGKTVTITEAKPEGRKMRFIGKWLVIGAGLFFGIHYLIFLVK